MAYSKFSIEMIKDEFGLEIVRKNFLNKTNISPSARLISDLEFAFQISPNSEKAKSEFLIAPIFREIIEREEFSISLFSGENLDIDFEKNLNGECDFLLTLGGGRLLVDSPIFSIVESKKNDIQLGIPQLLAQMIGARIWNEKQKNGISTIFGAITTGEIWQFVKLEDSKVEIEFRRLYISDIGHILGAITEIIAFFKKDKE